MRRGGGRGEGDPEREEEEECERVADVPFVVKRAACVRSTCEINGLLPVRSARL
jgi:hypothetical protein